MRGNEEHVEALLVNPVKRISAAFASEKTSIEQLAAPRSKSPKSALQCVPSASVHAVSGRLDEQQGPDGACSAAYMIG
jgi:hypothetical protein